MNKELKEEKQENLEENFAQIEKMIEKLEQSDVALDEAFGIYEAGMKKLKDCNNSIEQIEKKMLVMNEQGELEEF